MKVDIVIPVYNEEKDLEKNTKKLVEFLKKNFPHDWRIVIADNASIDRTLSVAKRLAKWNKKVSFIHLDLKGRGRALRKAWMASNADIVSYMDVDLSTNLDAFPKLISALMHGYDVAIGTRLVKESAVKRSFTRETLSRGYNVLVKVFLGTRFSDAQCGFKALKTDVAKKLVPLVKDNEFFFDTELLALAEKKGYRIFETPVHWIEDTGSTVRPFKLAVRYVKDLSRLRKDLGQSSEISTMGSKLFRLWLRLKKEK